MNSILFPTDFSENARAALQYFLEMHKGETFDIVVLNAFNLPHSGRGMILSINDIMQQDSEKNLAKEKMILQERFSLSAENIRTVSDMGTVAQSIARFLDREGLRLVVMGTKGASGIKGVLIGSNAADVISEVSSPVLLIPEGHTFKGLKHVVFAADYTPNKNERTLSTLLNIVRKHKSKVHLLNVRKSNSKLSPAQREAERKNLSILFSGTEFEHAQVDNENTSEGIKSYLADNDVDLLCMVPRKKGFFEKLFGGSRSEDMAKLASVPLLTLREN